MLARQISAEGRSRAFAGGAAVPVSALSSLADPLVAVHGQSDQHRLLRPAAQRDALDSFAGAKTLRLRQRFAELYASLRATESELGGRGRLRPGAGPRGRPAAVRPRRGRAGGPAAGRGRRAWPPRRRGWASPTPCAPPPSRPASASRPRTAAPMRSAPCPRARKLLDGVREHDTRGRGARRPAGGDQLPPLRRGGRRRVVRLGPRHRPCPPGRGLRAARRADRADPQVRRHHRRRAGLVRALGPAAARPRRHRRADRAADR